MSSHKGHVIGHIHRPKGKFVFVEANGDIRAMSPHRSHSGSKKKGSSRKSRKKGSRGKKKSSRR